jgi:hypothetical protein
MSWISEITESDVRGRAQVDRLALVDPAAALRLARTIAHPWYRCQSITAAAEHLSGDDQVGALWAAFAAAKEQAEPNRVVSVAAWPVRVMGRVDAQRAGQWICELVAIAATEEHNLRRAHALQSLAFATSSHPELLRLAIPALVEAVLGGHGPRIDRVIRDTWNLVASTHPGLLRSLAAHHKPGGPQRKLLASIPDGS